MPNSWCFRAPLFPREWLAQTSLTRSRERPARELASRGTLPPRALGRRAPPRALYPRMLIMAGPSAWRAKRSKSCVSLVQDIARRRPVETTRLAKAHRPILLPRGLRESKHSQVQLSPPDCTPLASPPDERFLLVPASGEI